MNTPFNSFMGSSSDVAEEQFETDTRWMRETPFVSNELTPFVNSEQTRVFTSAGMDVDVELEGWEQETPAGTLLSVNKNLAATKKNQALVPASKIAVSTLFDVLGKSVDFDRIRKSIIAANASGTSGKYQVSADSQAVDSVFTQAVYEFQQKYYIDPAEHDGIMGSSSLDSMGFLTHGLRPVLSSSGFYGQAQLNRSDVKGRIPTDTGGEFTAANWFNFIMRPAWLGIKIASGVHVLLLRKLQEAERWLMTQPQYKGMTPAELGKALGFNKDTSYSAARLSSDNQAMHGFGLAIDINVNGNPWIGAGWISNDVVKERYRMIQALRTASGDSTLPGTTVFAYLNSLAVRYGTDTRKVYDVLKKNSDDFVAYLRRNATEQNYWRTSYTFGDRNPLNGFLNLHIDLVCALRQLAGLAWGAIDFGPYASGDIMHFDLRTIGVGKFICGKIGGFVPTSGHPTLGTGSESEYVGDGETSNNYQFHEAIGEASWSERETHSQDQYDQTNFEDVDFRNFEPGSSSANDQYVADDHYVGGEIIDVQEGLTSDEPHQHEGMLSDDAQRSGQRHQVQMEQFIPEFFNQANIVGKKFKTAFQWGSKDDMAKCLEDIVRAIHPELGTKAPAAMTADEKKRFKETWVSVRTELFTSRKLLIQAGLIPALGGAVVPFGFIKAKYGSHEGLRPDSDYPLYQTERLDSKLKTLHTLGKITLTQEELDVFQRIANVETSGFIQTFNSYDAGVVSIGFMQFTLHVGKIQEWIKLAPAAFKRYGIELHATNKYNFADGQQPAINGVTDSQVNDLRWNGWAERFYYAGLDNDVISAEVALAKTYLTRHLSDLKARLSDNAVYNKFVNTYYNASTHVKGLFQESHNNNPSHSTSSVRDTIQYMIDKGLTSAGDFMNKYQEILRGNYGDRLVDQAGIGTNVVL